ELVIVKTDWDGLVPSLNSDKIDAIIAGMSPTEERKETIHFSDNYYNSDLVMVVKKGGDYENATSIQDFSGAKITAQLNTFHYSVIEQINGVSQ
ncbi:transporter substrate-binding domain-containing protein, partial [Bifidobacterium thermophilum]|nr:transporter substrate-binding domain-containing protein [Bifidobacterium thermophilum]